MAQLYVATNNDGEQRLLGEGSGVAWSLPRDEDGALIPGDVRDGKLLLSLAGGLLGRLDESIHTAEALAPVEASEDGRSVWTGSARLVGTTAWDAYAAALFALDCAEHVLGPVAATELPGGSTIGEALAVVRTALVDRAAAQHGLVTKLTDLALLHRLRRDGREIGDAAFAQFVEDQAENLEYLDDPLWTAIAASRDAVLAATEAVQHAAFPFVSEIESHSYERAEVSKDLDPSRRAVQPHLVRLSWVPPWIAADDAAERARQAARDAGGDLAAEAELAWQAERLETALQAG